MTPREMAAVVLRRRFGSGSALAEPSTSEVYEGRLTRSSVVGVNFLDRAEGQSMRLHEPAAVAPVQEWVPWCEECRLEPMDAYTLGGAEYLARQHDAVWHRAAWTARAVPAAEVARLLAVGGVR